MKTLKNLLTIALFASLIFSCTPTELTQDDDVNTPQQTQRTGGDDASGPDNTRD